MVKQRACRRCRFIHEEERCPKCGSSSNSESFKGRIEIFNSENSEIAQNLKLKEKGVYAIKSE